MSREQSTPPARGADLFRVDPIHIPLYFAAFMAFFGIATFGYFTGFLRFTIDSYEFWAGVTVVVFGCAFGIMGVVPAMNERSGQIIWANGRSSMYAHAPVEVERDGGVPTGEWAAKTAAPVGQGVPGVRPGTPLPTAVRDARGLALSEHIMMLGGSSYGVILKPTRPTFLIYYGDPFIKTQNASGSPVWMTGRTAAALDHRCLTEAEVSALSTFGKFFRRGRTPVLELRDACDAWVTWHVDNSAEVASYAPSSGAQRTGIPDASAVWARFRLMVAENNVLRAELKQSQDTRISLSGAVAGKARRTASTYRDGGRPPPPGFTAADERPGGDDSA